MSWDSPVSGPSCYLASLPHDPHSVYLTSTNWCSQAIIKHPTPPNTTLTHLACRLLVLAPISHGDLAFCFLHFLLQCPLLLFSCPISSALWRAQMWSQTVSESQLSIGNVTAGSVRTLWGLSEHHPSNILCYSGARAKTSFSSKACRDSTHPDWPPHPPVLTVYTGHS